MELDARANSIISDLRRAAVPGATGDAAERGAGVLVDSGAQLGVERFAPSTAPLAVAVDGPGLFVLDDGSRRLFGRLGDFHVDDAGRLVDGAGRAVLGHAIDHGVERTELKPIVAANGRGRAANYRIDARGVLCAVKHQPQTLVRRSRDVLEPVARLMLALFPVPQRLQRADATAFLPSPAAGAALFRAPGESGAGMLRPHVVAAAAIDMEGDLRALWLLRRKGELDAALAAASDECLRTALGLVR